MIDLNWKQKVKNYYLRYLLLLTGLSLLGLFLIFTTKSRSHYVINHEIKRKFTIMPFKEIRHECNSNLKVFDKEPWPPIFVITPTYSRPEQVPELIKLSYIFKFVPNLHWVISEDRSNCSEIIEELLFTSNLSYGHLISPMPEVYRQQRYPPKGVSGRRAGLEWIQQHFNTGVIYFADDDNMFTVELFNEIRSTKVISVFPVGLIGKLGVSSPIIVNDTVQGFYDSWQAGRKFPMDMAGFAVRLEFINSKPNATMPYHGGYEEDEFLRSLGVELHDLEPKANNCTQILVWHTKTVKNFRPRLNLTTEQWNTNLKELVHTMAKMTMILV